MSRVLHVVMGDVYAGAERVQDLLALRLPSLGHELHFACLKPGLFERVRRCDVPLDHFPMRGRLARQVALDIARRWPAGHFDLVHSHTLRSSLVARWLARLWGVPHVRHLHSATARDTEHRVRNWLNHQVERRLIFPAVDHFVCVAPTLADELRRQGVPADRVSVIPNGVPAVDASADWTPPAPAQPWVIGAVALWRPRKGLAVLLHALQRLRQQGLAVQLRVIGAFVPADHGLQMRALAQRLGVADHVVWAPFTDAVAAALQPCHLFALPSLYGEGLPMVVLEAMALGRPVVASDVEGVALALDHGRVGRLVPPGDADALAQALRQLMTQPGQAGELAAAARHHQQQHFSDEAMARAVSALYERVRAAPLRHTG